MLCLVPHNLLVGLWMQSPAFFDALAALVAGALVVLAARGGGERPWARFWLPAVALLGVILVSALTNRVTPMEALTGLREILPYVAVGLLASRLLGAEQGRRLVGWLFLLAVLVAAYGIAGYLAFRALGGRAAFPPAPESPVLAVLTYPYYCGHYPTGWRLVSTFMNDNYLGVWLALLLPVSWLWVEGLDAGRRRNLGRLGLTLMVVALTWTFSRGAALAAVVAVGLLCVRVSWKASWLVVPGVVAALLLASPGDVYRFTRPAETEGNRVHRIGLVGQAMRRKPVLGLGPGRGGLMDVQYAKVLQETGFVGLAVFLWLLAAAIGPAGKAKGAGGAGKAVGAGLLGVAFAAIGGESFENPQIAVTFWLLAGLAPSLSLGSANAPEESTAQHA